MSWSAFELERDVLDRSLLVFLYQALRYTRALHEPNQLPVGSRGTISASWGKVQHRPSLGRDRLASALVV